MSALPQLPETERQRLLQTMGFDIWVRRGTEALQQNVPSKEKAKALPERGAAPQTPGSERVAPPTSRRAAPSTQAPETSAELVRPRASSSSMRTLQAVLLVLEKRVDADAAMIKQLMRALPGCMVCTPDTISRGTAKFALQIGVDASLPADVLGIRAPTLAALRQSASAKRALWWSIKPVLKALKS